MWTVYLDEALILRDMDTPLDRETGGSGDINAGYIDSRDNAYTEEHQMPYSVVTRMAAPSVAIKMRQRGVARNCPLNGRDPPTTNRDQILTDDGDAPDASQLTGGVFILGPFI